MGTWPGETAIMEQWDWDRGEAPTLEFTREYTARPLVAGSALPMRLTIDGSGHMWRSTIHVQLPDGSWRLPEMPGFINAFIESGLIYFSLSEKRAIAKGKKKAAKYARLTAKHAVPTYGFPVSV